MAATEPASRLASYKRTVRSCGGEIQPRNGKWWRSIRLRRALQRSSKKVLL